jgi:hypothetical protein
MKVKVWSALLMVMDNNKTMLLLNSIEKFLNQELNNLETAILVELKRSD